MNQVLNVNVCTNSIDIILVTLSVLVFTFLLLYLASFYDIHVFWGKQPQCDIYKFGISMCHVIS